MAFRRKGKKAHAERQDWEQWKSRHAELLAKCGLPPGVLRTRRDWNYLLKYGYWCDGPYGHHINKIDFKLEEMNAIQLKAFRELLERVLTDNEKRRGNAVWHHNTPAMQPTPQSAKHDR